MTLTRDFAKQFTTRNVINISSLIALVRVKKCGLYSASKMARDVLIEHMVQGLKNIKDISSTLTAIVFLHYRVATKMALEISRYIMCRVRL